MRCYALRDQLQSVTKDRDDLLESIKSQGEAFATMKSRAEHAEKQLLSISQERDAARAAGSETAQKAAQLREENCQLAARLVEAEKKLAEVEKQRDIYLRETYNWAQSSKNDSAERDQLWVKIRGLEQKLQQAESSVPRWVPTSTLLPSKDDADEKGKVWAVDREGVDLVYAFVSSAINYDFWMTPIPLPTPTEEKEDAFMKWYMSIDPSPQQDAQKMMQLRTAFEAGSASNSPLTKD